MFLNIAKTQSETVSCGVVNSTAARMESKLTSVCLDKSTASSTCRTRAPLFKPWGCLIHLSDFTMERNEDGALKGINSIQKSILPTEILKTTG